VNLFYQPLIAENVHYLDPEESKHCTRVLRKKTGDLIDIADGKGVFYKASITDANPAKCTFRIEQVSPEPPRNFHLHIALSPTKNPDRTEWFVEKAVEIGVDEITFIDCEHTERTRMKSDRVHKIAISAMKQSLKASLPVIHGLTPFSTFISNPKNSAEKFIAFVDEHNPLHLNHVASPGKQSIVLIGPEGDFSNTELTLSANAGYQKVSLGKSRLRTETAGVVACHIINLINL
jgi:16S rRNA (uracil1498-N3)-methyltransferase